MGEYCEGEEGNITIPVEYNNTRTFAILDNGARVAIATKSLWEAWGKPAIRRTRLKLQLADGHLERPLGLLEEISISVCRVNLIHTMLAIMDVHDKPTYDIILGRPFMRQLKMIQDWGDNHIYLRHRGMITQVNTTTHTHQDVRRAFVEDYASQSMND